jgi:hypothetical protein
MGFIALFSRFQPLQRHGKLHATIMRPEFVTYLSRFIGSAVRKCAIGADHEELSANAALPAENRSLQHVSRDQLPN